MRYIGCHLSSSAGFAAMGRTALSIGANTFQFFTRNPRGSRAKPVDPADVAAYLALAMEARCYNGGDGRTKMKPLTYARRDAIAYVAVLCYLAGVIALRYV